MRIKFVLTLQYVRPTQQVLGANWTFASPVVCASRGSRRLRRAHAPRSKGTDRENTGRGRKRWSRFLNRPFERIIDALSPGDRWASLWLHSWLRPNAGRRARAPIPPVASG